MWIEADAFFADYQYYLSHQVLPPIERLCEPIEGTERARLAECLGKSTFIHELFLSLMIDAFNRS